MIENKRIMAIIPARGGSKGIPRKNIKPLRSKPLISYSIEQAKKSKYINKVVVSTEDDEIAEISKKYGAEIIKRPDKLAKDETPTIDVVFHVLEILKAKNYNPEIVVLLQPTSPLRNAEDIDNAIELFLNKECESVVSVCKFEHPPYWSFKIEKGHLKPLFEDKYFGMRRQDFENVYKVNGAIYISEPQILYEYKSFHSNHTIPYIMPIERSVDIDNEMDFLLAELLVKRYGLE
jgi:CMP-N,N'-diacetyllegionaminic acid synthase